MKIKMFAVHDSKAEAYLQPFSMRSKGEAIRAFQNSVNDPQTQFNKYPADFTLFEIGEYDELTGQIIPSNKIALGNAIEYKKTVPMPSLQPLEQNN